jgi:hypothetical protein
VEQAVGKEHDLNCPAPLLNEYMKNDGLSIRFPVAFGSMEQIDCE